MDYDYAMTKKRKIPWQQIDDRVTRSQYTHRIRSSSLRRLVHRRVWYSRDRMCDHRAVILVYRGSWSRRDIARSRSDVEETRHRRSPYYSWPGRRTVHSVNDKLLWQLQVSCFDYWIVKRKRVTNRPAEFGLHATSCTNGRGWRWCTKCQPTKTCISNISRCERAFILSSELNTDFAPRVGTCMRSWWITIAQ